MLSQTIERAITNRSNEMIPKIKQKKIKSDNFTRINRVYDKYVYRNIEKRPKHKFAFLAYQYYFRRLYS